MQQWYSIAPRENCLYYVNIQSRLNIFGGRRADRMKRGPSSQLEGMWEGISSPSMVQDRAPAKKWQLIVWSMEA